MTILSQQSTGADWNFEASTRAQAKCPNKPKIKHAVSKLCFIY